MLTFVGVGPGDPELVTLKAIRVLRAADAVAYADSGRGGSAAMDIVAPYIEGKPRCPLAMPMRGGREDWAEAHRAAAETLLDWLDRYERVAYPVLGDPGLYATSSYLMRRIAPKHPCAVVPGISAVNAMAACLGVPLVEQGEALTILDRVDPEKPFPEGNVVVMKCAKHLDALRAEAVCRTCTSPGTWGWPANGWALSPTCRRASPDISRRR